MSRRHSSLHACPRGVLYRCHLVAVDTIVSLLLTYSPVASGKALDGSMLGWLADAYSKGINEGEKLNIGDAWAQVSKSKNQQAATDAADLYAALCEALKKNGLPLGSRELDERHADYQMQAMRLLRQNSIGDDLDSYLQDAGDKIGSTYMDLRQYNSDVAKEICVERCKEAYAPLEDKVDAGAFETCKAYEAARAKVMLASPRRMAAPRGRQTTPVEAGFAPFCPCGMHVPCTCHGLFF